ncbi:MAG: AAA-like domain-containing protein [Candidatus Parabeggiatoa sp.]|nr:AAA-like domain-containing protein [Candidatus Parabeggiatoa sp.]
MLEVILTICGILGGLAAIDYFWGKWYTAAIVQGLLKKLRPKSSFIEQPDCTVPLDSPFYVERPPIESDCYEAIIRPDALIRIKAPGQMGKSSLMERILHHAKQHGARVVSFSFKQADSAIFEDINDFLQWFCVTVTRKLGLSADKVISHWMDFLGSKDNCTDYFQKCLLAEIPSSLTLGLDEVDEIFKYPNIAKDFLGLLRTWHEQGKTEEAWKKLRLVIVHSKEVYIPLDINQSPFNVGLPVELPELTQAQVEDLVRRYGLNWTVTQVEQLMKMVGGHPYLVQAALYQIARERTTLKQLLQLAPTEEGLYYAHLRRHSLNMKEDSDNLVAAMKLIVAANNPVEIDEKSTFKLRSMGLVKSQGNAVMPLCDLYRHYFRTRL